MEDFDFEFQPILDRKLVADLATLRFIAENRPVLFLGQPGCGKTHLAVALATKAVEAGYRGYFTTADDMVVTLVQARREGTWASKLKTLTAPTVLVIDDVGLLPMERGAAAAFFHVVNTRYERGHPTFVTTNRGFPSGARCSATPWWPLPSSTVSCTTPWCSTSRARRGGCASTRPSRRPRRPTSRPKGGRR